ncbi:MAG: hypothetical protein ACRBCK_09515 [Alphaproteobacteria bacterium]
MSILRRISFGFLAFFFGIGFLFNVAPVLAQSKDEQAAVKERFEALDNKQDIDGIVVLWQNNPSVTAFVIDTYLEGALALFEQSNGENENKIKAMYDRGLRGALAADKAFGRKVFSDYASSFIGWDDQQKRQFRSGQKFYGDAKEALKAKRYEDAFASANESISVARPLGDWWGVAVAQAVSGIAQEEMLDFQGALVSFSEARLLFHNFGMMEDLLRSEIAMARVLIELKRFPRALVSIDYAEPLALQLRDKDGQEELNVLRSLLHEK